MEDHLQMLTAGEENTYDSLFRGTLILWQMSYFCLTPLLQHFRKRELTTSLEVFVLVTNK